MGNKEALTCSWRKKLMKSSSWPSVAFKLSAPESVTHFQGPRVYSWLKYKKCSQERWVMGKWQQIMPWFAAVLLIVFAAGAPTVVLPGKFLLSNPSWMPGEWASNHQRWNCVCSLKLWDSRFESQWLPQHWDLMVPIPWLSGHLPLCTLTHTCVRWWHPCVRNAQESTASLENWKLWVVPGTSSNIQPKVELVMNCSLPMGQTHTKSQLESHPACCREKFKCSASLGDWTSACEGMCHLL